MIKIAFGKYSLAPIFLCDVCGERIHSAHEGHGVFRDEPDPNSFTTAVFHAHKGECDRIIRARGMACWTPFDQHLRLLMKNVGLAEKLKENDAISAFDVDDIQLPESGFKRRSTTSERNASRTRRSRTRRTTKRF